MPSSAEKYIQETSRNLDRHEKYNFIIVLLGDNEIRWSCVATSVASAWLLAARQACVYNSPCMSVRFEGRELENGEIVW